MYGVSYVQKGVRYTRDPVNGILDPFLKELRQKLNKLESETKPRDIKNNRPVKVQLTEYKKKLKEFAKAKENLKNFNIETVDFIYKQTKVALRSNPDCFYPHDIEKLKDKAKLKNVVTDQYYQVPYSEREGYNFLNPLNFFPVRNG